MLTVAMNSVAPVETILAVKRWREGLKPGEYRTIPTLQAVFTDALHCVLSLCAASFRAGRSHDCAMTRDGSL